MRLSVLVALAGLLALAACGGGGGGGAPAGVTLDPGIPTGVKGLTVFPQTTPALDLEPESLPGQANIWDLSQAFGIGDGGDDQWDGALDLTVNGGAYPANQTFTGFIFSTPFLTAANDGVIGAAVTGTSYLAPLAGTRTAYLAGLPEVRLQQTLNLSTATGTATLTWQTGGSAAVGIFPGDFAFFRVFVRTAAGATLTGDISAQSGGFTLGAPTFTSQPIIISFEARSVSKRNTQHDVPSLDSVSVLDGAATQFVVNGGFETGTLAGWTVDRQQVVQNVTSEVRTVGGFQVTRSFYTQPNKLWGRWADVFVNSTTGTAALNVTYTSDLGSDNEGVIYVTPNCSNQAITSWDTTTGTAAAGDRDVGILFGAVQSVTFTSDTTLGAAPFTGSEIITHRYATTVAPGGRATIVQFMVMNGRNTRITATSVSDRATEIDIELKRIFDGLRSNPEFRRGMTEQQISTVINF